MSDPGGKVALTLGAERSISHEEGSTDRDGGRGELISRSWDSPWKTVSWESGTDPWRRRGPTGSFDPSHGLFRKAPWSSKERCGKMEVRLGELG